MLFLKDFIEINIEKIHSKFSKEIFLKSLQPLFSGSFKALGKNKKNNFPVCKNIEIVRKNILSVCKNIEIVRKNISGVCKSISASM